MSYDVIMKNKIIKILALIVIIPLIQSCGNQLKSKTYSYGDYRWVGKSHVVYEFPLSMKAEMEVSVMGIADHINSDILGKNMIVVRWVDYNPNSYNGNMDGKNRIYFLEEGNPQITKHFSNDTLAVTVLWGQGRNILETDISFLGGNVEDYYFEGFHNSTGYDFDFWGILLHEMGHSLGLDHDDTEGGSAMSSSIGRGDISKRTFSQSEIDRIKSKYR